MHDTEALEAELRDLIASLGGCNQAEGRIARSRIEDIHRAIAAAHAGDEPEKGKRYGY